jgi:hypothetical protein
MTSIGKAPDEGLQISQRGESRSRRRDDLDRDLGLTGRIQKEGGIGQWLVRTGTRHVEPKLIPVFRMRVWKISEHKAIG